MIVLNFIVKYWKILLLIIIGIVIYIAINNLMKEKKKLEQENTLIKIKKQGTIIKIVKVYVDSSGSKHVVIGKNDNIVNSKVIDTVRIGLSDSTARILKIKQDQLNQITKLYYSVSGKNVLLGKKIDSLTKKAYYEYEGKYLHFKEVDIDSTHRVGSYVYKGDIQYTDYQKRSFPIIGALHSYTDIFSTDTSFRIGSIQRLTIEHLPSVWNFKLKATALYNIGVGPKIEIGYKHWTLSGQRLYNIQGKGINLIGLDYTIQL